MAFDIPRLDAQRRAHARSRLIPPERPNRAAIMGNFGHTFVAPCACVYTRWATCVCRRHGVYDQRNYSAVRRHPSRSCGRSCRLRREPAAAGRAAASGGDGRQAGQAHHRRSGRVCRALRRGRVGRNPLARLRLSRQGAFQGRPARQAGRPPLHHRPPAVPEHARSGARQSRAGEGQSRLHRVGPAACAVAGARPDHHRAAVRSAHAGEPYRAGPGRGAGGGRETGRARSAVHRTARAGHRPYRRPSHLARQSRHRRPRGQHVAARHHRLDRSDPFRVHLRRGVVPALRAAGAIAAG